MPSPSFPTRKISETIIDFAEPLLVHVDSTVPEQTIRQGFDIAVTIWNAFVMDRVQGNSNYETLMRRELGAQWEQNPVIRALVDRRLKHFHDDLRLVAEHRVSFDATGYKLWAAASDPYPSPKK